MRYVRLQLLYLYSLLLATQAIASNSSNDVFILPESILTENFLNVDRYAQCWVDTTNNASVNQVRENQHEFRSLSEGISLDEWRHPLWIRLELQNQTTTKLNYFLTLGLHQYTEVFVFNDERLLSQYQLGNFIPLKERAM